MCPNHFGISKDMRIKSFVLIPFLLIALDSMAQGNGGDMSYRRSSLYMMAIIDPMKPFGEKLSPMFSKLPFPDKYNDHAIGMRSFRLHTPKDSRQEFIRDFLDNNQIARRMVAKWFNRQRNTGRFDMSYVARMGQYNASLLDAEIARQAVRGLPMLDDAGEELINNTFVIVYDFIFKSNINFMKALSSATSNKAGVSLDKFLNDAQGGYTDDLMSSYFSDLDKEGNDLYSSFKADVVFYLFKLRWNEAVSNDFYTRFWCDAQSSNALLGERKALFDNEQELFKLDYVGESVASTEMVSVQGCHNNSEVLSKMLARVIDKNVVELQRKFEVFKIKVPLFSTEPLMAKVGLKEGITKNSQFEVLEMCVDKQGKTQYNQVAIIVPEEGKIWDNRFMAAQEQALNANLMATTFKKISGRNLYPGMLIRELK